MSDEVLIYKKNGPVAWLTLNRPQVMNAISLDMLKLYERYLPQIAADESNRVLVLTGSGSAFCAGVDLKDLLKNMSPPPGEIDFLDRLCDNVIKQLRNFPKPVIAALNGITLAGGLETAMCADIVIAAENIEIGDAHANYGLYPGAGGVALLPNIVPRNVAKYLLLTGNNLSAEQLHTYGFVNEVVPAEMLIDTAQNLAEVIASKSPIGLRRMKIVANEALGTTPDVAFALEQVEFRKHLRSWDMHEGLKAFSEKRKPQFLGR